MSRLMVYSMRFDWEHICRCFAEHPVRNWQIVDNGGAKKMYVELEDGAPDGAGTHAEMLKRIAEQQNIQTGILGEILEAARGAESGQPDGHNLSWPPRRT